MVKRSLDTFNLYLSFTNIQLILAQNNQASRVAGFQTWKKLDRHVKKGAKALYIYAPLVTDKKDKEGNLIVDDDGQPIKNSRFLLKPVFDVSQTDGETPLPSLVNNIEEDLDDPKKFASYYKLLKELSPVDVMIKPIETTANGYYHTKDKHIVVKEGLGEVMTLKVLLHEITHARLHSNSSTLFGDETYRKQEFEAESVAYIVSQHLGFDTSDYSFGYLSSWTHQGNDLEGLSDSLKKITEEAKKLIDEVDAAIEKIVTLDAPQNKFEERVAIAQNKPIPLPRAPKKEFKQESGKQKKTVDDSLSKRLSQQS